MTKHVYRTNYNQPGEEYETANPIHSTTSVQAFTKILHAVILPLLTVSKVYFTGHMNHKRFFVVTISAIVIAAATFFITMQRRPISPFGYEDYYFDTVVKTPIPIARIVEQSHTGTQSATMEQPHATKTASLATPSAKLRLAEG